MNNLLVDSHCHLDFPDFKGREEELLAAMKANGVGWALVAGVTLERLPGVLALTERFPNLFAAAGVHPDTEEQGRGTR
jgi:TatD DNase family protein